MTFTISIHYVAPGDLNPPGWAYTVGNKQGAPMRHDYSYSTREQAMDAAETWATHKAKASRPRETYEYTPEVDGD